MQALGERIDYLTSFLVDMKEYHELRDLGCIFFDGYLLYDPRTRTQLEFDRYFLKQNAATDWKRIKAIVTNYTSIVAQLSKLNDEYHCVDKFRQLPSIRDAFYRQIIRERVYNGLFLWWHNMNGFWRIRFTSFDLPWGYYDVYRLGESKPSEIGKSRLERMHLYLTEDDMRKDSRSIMFVEDYFNELREELKYLG